MSVRTLALSVIISILLAPLIQPDALSGQSLWTQPSPQKSVGLEVQKPFFDGEDISHLSSVHYLSVNWPLSERIHFVGELPLAYGSYDDGYDSSSDFALGNAYMGVKVAKEASNIVGQVGVRLPLTSSGDNMGVGVGMWTDYTGRLGAFWPDVVPITGTVTYRRTNVDGLVFSLIGGADTWISTEEYGDRVEAWGLYGARLGHESQKWAMSGGIVGRAILTESGGNMGERTVHEIGLDVGYRETSVQPTLFVRVPVDEDLQDVVRAVVGLGIRTRIR